MIGTSSPPPSLLPVVPAILPKKRVRPKPPCRLDEGLQKVLAALTPEREKGLAVGAGLQAAGWVWGHPQPEQPVGLVCEGETSMVLGLCGYLRRNDAGTIWVLAATNPQRDRLTLSLAGVSGVHCFGMDDDLPSEPPRWVLVCCVRFDFIRQNEYEGQLATVLVAASAAASGLVIIAPNSFVRAASSPSPVATERPWPRGWRGIMTLMRASAYRLPGTDVEAEGRVSEDLPLCCPRHPTSREDASLVEGFPPEGWCTEVCMQEFKRCDAKAVHLCPRPCHPGDHDLCVFPPESTRLPCGHPNRRLCGRPPSCGFAETVKPGCMSVRVAGWDSQRFCVRSEVVRHEVAVPCGKKPGDMRCEFVVETLCPACRGTLHQPCFQRKDKSRKPDCPACIRLESELRQKTRARLASERASKRAQEEQEQQQLRVRQAEAAQRGVFVDGQKVMLLDVKLLQDPGEFETVFGERRWTKEQPRRGAMGTVRGRGSHPSDPALLVYLVEGKGQEHFLVAGKGLSLCVAVRELPRTQANVLLITAGGAAELSAGTFAVYEPPRGEDGKNALFDPSPFEGLVELTSRGVKGPWYTPSSPPPRGCAFECVERMRHPDGSNVWGYVCQEAAGGKGHWLVAKHHALRATYQKGQKVLVLEETAVEPPNKYSAAFPEAGDWMEGHLKMRDSGTIAG
eukprot:Hpha_TRINITY_DN30208_c0_g1::TRINITY_DN30208_c0_g1_i1::g.27190::m.27190